MTDATIRAAKMTDEPAILELARREMYAQEALDRRFRLREDAGDRYAVYLRERMRDMDSAVFVAEREGAVVGLGVGSVRKQETLFALRRFGYVSDLMVEPASRRQGIGRRLYERIALWLRGQGVDVVRLHVAARSIEAARFWRSLGAEEFLSESWIELGRMPAVPKDAGVTADDTELGVRAGENR
jgi:GNAT superfamily N-acetyltransferase